MTVPSSVPTALNNLTTGPAADTPGAAPRAPSELLSRADRLAEFPGFTADSLTEDLLRECRELRARGDAAFALGRELVADLADLLRERDERRGRAGTWFSPDPE